MPIQFDFQYLDGARWPLYCWVMPNSSITPSCHVMAQLMEALTVFSLHNQLHTHILNSFFLDISRSPSVSIDFEGCFLGCEGIDFSARSRQGVSASQSFISL